MTQAQKRLLVLFGNQLFGGDIIEQVESDSIFMAESEAMCRRYKAHRHKIMLILSAMRSKADALRESGHEVFYVGLEQSPHRAFTSILSEHLASYGYEQLVTFRTDSPTMERRLDALCSEHGMQRIRLESPKFLTTRDELSDFLGSHKRLFMADFYRWQRRRMHVMMDEEGKPVGGQWSFDADNRKKLPRGLVPPPLMRPRWTRHTRELASQVDDLFAEHPGRGDDFWLPTTEAQAEAALSAFLEERFHSFGDYEDALSRKHATLFHSVLSPLLNVGLLTPRYVLGRALDHAEREKVPINSLEGFVRQVIGWREFIRGVWGHLPASHWEQNFWDHHRKLTDHWYEGTTGIPPLDDAIRRASSRGYNHHIERLMVIGNAMLLCRVEPRAAYRWFMEMYVDSADWVMAPNVYGMALFSEGGAFTTKPYICGSNYLTKMSDYEKGPWCDVIDGLYWAFIEEHRDRFEDNPRSKMMVHTLDRMSTERKERIFPLAHEFIDEMTTA